MQFLITIDTEGDNQWDHGREISVENIKYIPRFQQLCEKYQIKPTYLVTSEVCQDEYARNIFRDYLSRNVAEIGSHLHSWTTPPFLDKDGFRFNDNNHAFATELPQILLDEKIKNLTEEIESSFGRRPTSFRSGRYGFNTSLAKILAENKYLVDSSVTPFTSWKKNKGIYMEDGGPDFIKYTPSPYRYNFLQYSLLEIPITILPTKFPLNKNEKLAQQFFKKVDGNISLRMLRKLFFKNQPLWLRPFPWMRIESFIEIYKEAADRKLPFLVMMFHSSELMPNCSTYRASEKDVNDLFELLEDFFRFLREKEVASSTLTEAAIKF